MTDFDPTEQQITAIRTQANMVVIAVPGSGKTYVLSEKIRAVLPTLPHYKGVVAISFTNKASAELEKRSLRDGMLKGSSFFGTIDSFYVTEIIFPFGRHIFGEPGTDLLVEAIDKVGVSDNVTEAIREADDGIITNSFVTSMGRLYVEGKVLLEAIGCLASHIFEQSSACRRYLKARFSHIFIDEYQDCGIWQHRLFMGMVDLGITGVVVGDVNQSIFAFAKRDSRYLTELTQREQRFSTFPLTRNHRSHQSIVNYATRLLSASAHSDPVDEIRVFEKLVKGSEVEIASWLKSSIPEFARSYDIARNQIAILVKSQRTSDLIHQYIDLPHKQVITTPLDQDSSLWGGLFRCVLTWAFSDEATKYELVEAYLNVDFQLVTVQRMMSLLREIEKLAATNPDVLKEHLSLFTDIAKLVFPRAYNASTLGSLKAVLSDRDRLNSFVPPKSDEVQIMTLHRSKGLEFDVVFHLDLYRWILPMYNGDFIQDLNLHYVGITRAKHACILCTSTERHRSNGDKVSAENSEFLTRNGLSSNRVPCPI